MTSKSARDLMTTVKPNRAAKEKKGREREKGEREQAPKEPCEDRSITSKC